MSHIYWSRCMPSFYPWHERWIYAPLFRLIIRSVGLLVWIGFYRSKGFAYSDVLFAGIRDRMWMLDSIPAPACKVFLRRGIRLTDSAHPN
jgi:hypothetical protein